MLLSAIDEKSIMIPIAPLTPAFPSVPVSPIRLQNNE